MEKKATKEWMQGQGVLGGVRGGVEGGVQSEVLRHE